MKPEIVEYQPEYQADYKRLSYEWLEKYVSVEPEDERILNDPEGMVLEGGGMIFFVRLEGELVGTVTMIRMYADVYELAKLAVTERCKGQNLGGLLLEHAIAFARERGAKRIVLYTNHALAAAIRLYRKYGFHDVPIVKNKYIESDMKMELDLV